MVSSVSTHARLSHHWGMDIFHYPQPVNIVRTSDLATPGAPSTNTHLGGEQEREADMKGGCETKTASSKCQRWRMYPKEKHVHRTYIPKHNANRKKRVANPTANVNRTLSSPPPSLFIIKILPLPPTAENRCVCHTMRLGFILTVNLNVMWPTARRFLVFSKENARRTNCPRFFEFSQVKCVLGSIPPPHCQQNDQTCSKCKTCHMCGMVKSPPA